MTGQDDQVTSLLLSSVNAPEQRLTREQRETAWR